MEKQHLTYFKIENFKRFDSFEMSNLGQFNLIVGDNNVGKTSVLEGLLFDEDLDQLMVNFWGSVGFRKVFDFKDDEVVDIKTIKATEFWLYIFKNISKPLYVSWIDNGQKTITYDLTISTFRNLHPDAQNQIRSNVPNNYPDDWIILMNDQSEEGPSVGAYFETSHSNVFEAHIPFLPVNTGYGQDLVNYFFQRVNADKEVRKSIEAELKDFIPNLEEIRIHRHNNKDLIGITLTDSNGIYPITRFGDGTIKLIRFLIEVVLSEGKRLMVDEIGSGIHFTRLTSYWKTIIQLCDKYKVQLFATTHSVECQQAFIEALEAPEMVQYQKDARNISLIENKEGKVEAITFDFEQFEYALNIGFNTRGGKR